MKKVISMALSLVLLVSIMSVSVSASTYYVTDGSSTSSKEESSSPSDSLERPPLNDSNVTTKNVPLAKSATKIESIVNGYQIIWIDEYGYYTIRDNNTGKEGIMSSDSKLTVLIPPIYGSAASYNDLSMSDSVIFTCGTGENGGYFNSKGKQIGPMGTTMNVSVRGNYVENNDGNTTKLYDFTGKMVKELPLWSVCDASGDNVCFYKDKSLFVMNLKTNKTLYTCATDEVSTTGIGGSGGFEMESTTDGKFILDPSGKILPYSEDLVKQLSNDKNEDLSTTTIRDEYGKMNTVYLAAGFYTYDAFNSNGVVEVINATLSNYFPTDAYLINKEGKVLIPKGIYNEFIVKKAQDGKVVVIAKNSYSEVLGLYEISY